MDLQKLIEALKENGLKDEEVAETLAALKADIEEFLEANGPEPQDEPEPEPAEEGGKAEDKKESEGEKRLRVFGI